MTDASGIEIMQTGLQGNIPSTPSIASTFLDATVKCKVTIILHMLFLESIMFRQERSFVALNDRFNAIAVSPSD